MPDKLTIEISDELKAAVAVANVDVAASIAQVQEQIIQRANQARCQTLLTAFVQLPGAVQDKVLAAVASEMEVATKAGTLKPERASLVRQMTGPGGPRQAA